MTIIIKKSALEAFRAYKIYNPRHRPLRNEQRIKTALKKDYRCFYFQAL